MSDASQMVEASPIPEIRVMAMSDLSQALHAGWRDFLRAPGLGLFFGLACAIGGWIVLTFTVLTDLYWYAMPFVVGFPLVGPFMAVGLYELSRRMEAGQSWTTGDILSVIWRQKDRQLPSISAIIIIYFLFWSTFAHMLFALFLGPSALTNVTSSYAYLLQPEGLVMLVVGTAIGAVFALILFNLTVIALPLLLDKELDFVTAMVTSFRVVLANPLVMITWGLIISALTFAAMIPAFLGLLVVLPVLGHASWHIYRAALIPRD